jgi:hypothetical protein
MKKKKNFFLIKILFLHSLKSVQYLVQMDFIKIARQMENVFNVSTNARLVQVKINA